MAKSYDVYPSETGGATDYALSFEYLDVSHVKATVSGVPASFTTLSTYMIRMDVAPVGALKIYRETPTDELINEYTDGSVLIDDQLNRSFLQSAFVAEEVSDNSLQQDVDGAWDAANLVIKDVATPVNPSDVPNKSYVDSILPLHTAERVAAEAAQSAAESARDASVTKAEEALASANSAEALFDAFGDLYLGSKTTNPTLDNDGNPLQDGAVHWNSTAKQWRAYDLGGAEWVSLSSIGSAGLISLTPTGNVQSSDVQAAITELDTEKLDKTEGMHVRLLVDGVDLNTITTAGSYRCFAVHPNIPDTGYGQLLVVRGAGDTLAQIYFPYDNSNVWTRQGNPSQLGSVAGFWRPWVRLLNTKDIPDLGSPVGTSIMYNGPTTPAGYLKENGAAYSRTVYAKLFAKIGTTFGAGDGSTTFNVPDTRAEFIRGLDDGRGIDVGRVLGVAQGSQNKSHTHTGSTNTTGNHSHSLPSISSYHSYGSSIFSIAGFSSTGTYNTSSAGNHSHTLTINAEGGSEARPRNQAKLFCIKY